MNVEAGSQVVEQQLGEGTAPVVESSGFWQECSDAFAAVGKGLGLILDDGDQLGELQNRLDSEILDIDARLEVSKDLPFSPDARERELAGDRRERLRVTQEYIERALLAGSSPAEIIVSSPVRPTAEEYYPASKVLRDFQKASKIEAPELSKELGELKWRINRRVHDIEGRLETEGEFWGASAEEVQLIRNEAERLEIVKTTMHEMSEAGRAPIEILSSAGVAGSVSNYYPSLQRKLEKMVESES